MRKFDLNIEKVLEDWEIFHALREIIANAIDEHALTDTADITIFKDEQNKWHVRDFGRGLKYEHLTQNENDEKLSHPDLVIGKFGVGLKDALATLDRHNVQVCIQSKFGDITLGKSSKHGFDDVVTLHAFIADPADPEFIGTEFIFDTVSDQDIEAAKDFFLIFSDEQLLEKTKYGQVLKRNQGGARIYINGVRVAEEEHFLFSYNITSLTQVMRKALNRERTHVGRNAYTDRVKSILLECHKTIVAELLVADIQQFATGMQHDELKWLDVAVHACKLLNTAGQAIFLTAHELIEATDVVDRASADGYHVVTIPDNIKEKLQGLTDMTGKPIRDLGEYKREWNRSFEFIFVKKEQLTAAERVNFDLTDQILEFVGGKPRYVKDILISETMRLETKGYQEAVGMWDGQTQRIIIKRSQLKHLKDYAGTLLHEIAHARSGATDITREFEQELTNLLGLALQNVLKSPSPEGGLLSRLKNRWM